MREIIRQQTVESKIYGLGFIGAVIYFISHASGLWSGIVGIIKAIFWPAILVYKAFEALY